MPKGSPSNPEPIEDGSLLAGLTVLELVTEEGETWSPAEMAIVCGCSIQAITNIERRALRKLRPAFIEAFKKRGIIMENDTEHELTQKIWAVITHDRVVENNIPYNVARETLNQLGPDMAKEATIVTNTAANRMEDPDA